MTHDAPPDITMLVPTRALPERLPMLQRAIDSILGQCDVFAKAIVIVNGAHDNHLVRRTLGSDPRVRVIHRADADLPAALREGAQSIDTGWFGALDDDDLLLPGALKVRHAALARHPDRTVVVTNGLSRTREGDSIHVTNGREIEEDPLRALLRRNWMLPGSWLCRVTPITRAVFDLMPRHLECTYLGLRFAALGMVWLDTPTVVYHVGSPFSASQTRAYVQGQAAALGKILELDLPPYAARALRRRIAAAHHRSANLALEAHDIGDAWRWHLATLRATGGWRYLPFMRHLLKASVRHA